MKQKILEILKSREGYVSGQEICEYLNVSRTAVWKSVNSLRKQGYVIDSSTNKGYRLCTSVDFITADGICDLLKTKHIGKDIYVLDSVDSTNNFAKTLGQNGAKSGIAVLAREQTGGKGRLGRLWEAPKDTGLYLSVLLRPDISPQEISSVTPLAGLAVYRVLKRLCAERTFIKWPNDIIIGNKKVCGILTELSAESDRINYLVIGIGINTDKGSFPKEISERATSIYEETGEIVEKSGLAAEILNELETVFEESNFRIGDKQLAEYKTACASLGRNIGFIRAGKNLSGLAIDIDLDGSLVVKCTDGEIYNLTSGEATVSGIY